MKKNIKAVLSSALLIAGTLGLTVGATTALFTNDARADVKVVAGKVNVSMIIKNLTTLSGKYNETTANYDLVQTEQNGIFTNGGTASVTDGVLKLDRISPMDKVEFDVEFTNSSNIDIQYRTVKEVIEDSGLFAGLEVKVDDTLFEMTEYSDWEEKAAGGTISGYHVSVTLPKDAGNEYQEKSCKIKFGIEAVQGNAHVENAPEDADYTIYNAYDMQIFGQKALTDTFAGKTITLMNDIDLANVDWTGSPDFRGTFDGNEKTISNLSVKGNKKVGLFGMVFQGTVKDLVIDSAKVEGINAVGAVAGLAYYANIEGCTVKNADVVAKVANNDDGDKVGAVVGRLSVEEGTGSVKNCRVEDSKVTGYRQVGGVLGGAYKGTGSYDISGNTAKNISLVCDMSVNYNSLAAYTDVNYVVGTDELAGTVEGTNTKSLIEPAVINNGTIDLSSVEEGGTVVIPASNESDPKLSGIPNNITVKGTKDAEGNLETVIDATAGGNICSVPNGATFEDLVLENGQSGYHGFQHAGLITFKGCTIKGLLFSYGNMVFEDCLFEQTSSEYNMWAYGMDLTFKNCTFKSYGKFINVYNEGALEYTVNFEGCHFINLLGEAKKAAVNVKETNGSTLLKNRTVIKNCTTEGLFPTTSGIPAADNTCIYYNSLVMIDDRSTNGAGLVKVTYNDQVIYENGVLR